MSSNTQPGAPTPNTPEKQSAHLVHKVHETLPEDRVPIPKRVAYGIGNFSDHMGTQTLIGNANPIFNVGMHLDPRLIGISIAIMRLWDAITDPILGVISDNARTRWGRRRPFMLFGAIISGILFPILWFVPEGMQGTALFLWFTVFSILFFTSQTCFTIPWTALGYELTPDYNERTRVMEMRAYLAKAVGLFLPWAYAFTQLPIWGGSIYIGARAMGITVGIIIGISGLIPVIFLRERYFKRAQNQQKTPLFKGIWLTLSNRPFMMMVAITFFTVVGGRTIDHLGFYIGLYYLFDGDTVKQGILAGITGNVAFVIGLASVFILNRVSQRIGKRKALGLCLVMLVLSSFVKYLCYTPKYPYLSLVVLFFTVPSSAGFWLLISSIKADICDDDEMRTGLRREGSIGAVSAWISKFSSSATAVLAGFVLVYTGYNSTAGASQATEVIDKMRWFYYIIPSATAIPALLLLWWFPISEERARENRRILEERRGKL